MFKRIFCLSALLAVSAFAAQVVVKSGALRHQDVAIIGESTWDKLANATSQTTQELLNSGRSFIKSASFLLPDALIQSLTVELPSHDATVGSTPGQAGVSGGSASYSIPIALPPGRKGMQPNISLSYRSKGGNGIAGMGWNVSGLSSLHRCPQTLEQDGQIRAVDYSMNDRLCFDGQRLVATSGTYGAVNTKYSTEIDSFARITQLGGDLNSTNSYFKVEYKSGKIAYFGGTTTAVNNARAIAGGLTKPLNWLIARSEDRLGNNIVYNYTNFTNGEVLPAAIFYTGFNTTQGDRKVEFIYEARPISNGAKDQSSSYLAGGLTRQTQRLTTIKTWVNTEAVNEYRLSYALSAATGRSLLSTVTQCAFLGAAVTCRRPTQFAWNQSAIAYEFHPLNFSSVSTLIPSHALVLGIQVLADFNGDGDNEWGVNTQDANNPGLRNFNLLRMTADHKISTAFQVPNSLVLAGDQYGDFDLDGRPDVLARDSNGNLQVYFWHGLADATTFTTAFNEVWNTGIAAIAANYVGDMDGDGRADMVIQQDNPSGANSCKRIAQVWLNVSGANNAPSSFVLAASHCLARTIYSTNFYLDESIGDVRDYNGDGIADIAVLRPNGTAGQIKDRILFGTRVMSYTLNPQTFASFFISTDPIQAAEQNPLTLSFWIDMNGDGLDDFLYARNDAGVGRWTIRLNTGTKLGARILLSSNYGIEACDRIGSALSCPTDYWNARYASRISIMDIDNDGRPEILVPRLLSTRYCTKIEPNPAVCGEPLSIGNSTKNFGSVITNSNIDDQITNNEIQSISPLQCQTRYICAANASGGPSGLSFQSEFNNGEIGPVSNAYSSGLGSTDNNIYQMDALNFSEIAAGQFNVAATTTSIQSGYLNGPPQDAYGDGLADSFARVPGCSLPYCVRPVADSNGVPYPPSVSPFTFTGGYSTMAKQIFINENIGTGGIRNTDGLTPQVADMMVMATDGLANQTRWNYYPLNSKANRNLPTDTPLYSLPTDLALRYVDARHSYFSSSMQVVSEMTQSNGIGSNANTTRYSYSEAMYNTQGRGFQGFRKIIEEDMSKDAQGNSTGLRTTTTFSQKYPLTSLVEKTTTTLVSKPEATAALLNYTVYLWRCNRANRADTTACGPNAVGTNPIRFPFLDWKETVTFNLAAATAPTPSSQPYHIQVELAADSPNCDRTMSTTSGYDAYGNLTAQTFLAADYGANGPNFRNYVDLICKRTRNTFETADTTNWWLDKLTQTQQTNSIVHGVDQSSPAGVSNPQQTTTTAYSWNTNRTLATETFQNGIANQQKHTAYTYPGTNYGLPLSVTVTASGDQNAGGRTTSTTYSPDGYFPLSVTNALGHTATTAVRLRDGLPISVTDPNGLRTITTYDAFSQATLVKARGVLDSQYLAPDKQVAATWCTVTNSINSCGLSDAAYQLTSVQDGSPTSVSTHDKLGRVLRTQSKLLDGTTSVSDTQYNNKGQTAAQSLPYRSGDTPLWTYFVSYDQIGRLTAKTSPQQHATRGDMVTTYIYNGDTTTIQVCGSLDSDNSQCLNLSRSVDVLGRYVETADALGGVTKFWYDANGQALVLQDVKGNQIKATYNAIGQRTSANDPNQGISTFTYNALSEVLTQTDARAITSTTSYDKLGRKTQFSVTADENGDGVNDAIVDTWSYDPTGAKGQLAQSQRTINGVLERQESSSFDALIRPSSVAAIQYTGSGSTRSYSSEFQYDTYYGRMLAQFFPNGEGEQFIFNQYGYETEQRNAVNASIYRQIVSVDSAGRPTRELKGFNLSTDTAYWPNGQTKSIIHQKDGVTIRKINYAYDVFGNVATQELNQGMTGNTLEKFSYDSLHRLTQSLRTGAASTTVTYGYDAAGNFNFKSDFSLATGTPYNLSTGGLGGGGANAVKSVQLKAGGTRSYGYDAQRQYDGRQCRLCGNLRSRKLGDEVTTWCGDQLLHLRPEQCQGPPNRHRWQQGLSGWL